MSTRDDSLSVPWADSPASVSMPQPSSASTTPRGGDALGRAAMQVQQYQEAVNAAIAANDMDKALRMEELLNKATRRLQDMELAQFHSPRSRSVSNISTGGVSGGNYTHTWWEIGPLGITIKAKAPSHDTPDGVKLSRVDHDQNRTLPTWLVEGLELREVEGTDVTRLSYSRIRDMLRNAERPLTMRFGFGSDTGAAISAPAASGERRASGKDVTRAEVSSPEVASGDPNPLEKGAILRQLEARMLNRNDENTTSTAPSSTTSTVSATEGETSGGGILRDIRHRKCEGGRSCIRAIAPMWWGTG